MLYHRHNSKTAGWVVLFGLLLLGTSLTWATGKLVGKAVDGSGEPIEGVVIKMIPLDKELPTVEAQSKKNGKFVFGLLRPARYRLVAFMDGMRISRIDANVAVPEDDSLWAYHDDVPPGAEMPAFSVSGVSNVSYDLTFTPAAGGPGEYGTGIPVSPTSAIVELIQAGQLQDALGEVDRTLESYPDNATLHYLKGFVLIGLELPEEAVQSASRALELEPGFEGGNLLIAKIREGQGDLAGALASYEKERAVARSPEVQRDVYIGLASTYIKQNKLEDAAAALEQLIVVDPNNTGAFKELADIYVRLGREDKAAEMLDRAESLGGSDPNILYNMGAERYNAGDLEAAADYFRRAIEIKPDFADAHRQLAFAHLSLNNREGAIEHLKKYLELHGGEEADEQVQTAKAILQQLTQQN